MKQYFDEHMKTHTGESLSFGCVHVASEQSNIYFKGAFKKENIAELQTLTPLCFCKAYLHTQQM